MRACVCPQIFMWGFAGVCMRGLGESVNTLCAQAHGAKAFRTAAVWLQVHLVFACAWHVAERQSPHTRVSG